ncbi:LacI family DNA-binding transcriptional regulator [Sinorhizobium meliloti]|uniref:LacI family DNA-binding transcriptional regulator n=6 Tax=Rhizobium meliloti TaxID=382 RepID=UPI000FD5A592|nr:LacI family DNA-binding transcriptional regulator [Sinorhizobium meliloti]QND28831.1 LacI family DNA-binding transcriptional regulator [Sinorhizobium meliloti]RVG63473.1 LacI family DNA-binding transcriptional regulator [Sinorhizobium meliloti]RVK39426.1 LacI family DNA-binding transcriptional regulator [Sinorhizobium meliloti]RVK82235.1 LacI family DNA-binding transcriptional regulator [Sinorhizobium meliloti]RVO42526.1 LacI family DNA-binding transcriptional regulator [Sinorhizobium melil
MTTDFKQQTTVTLAEVAEAAGVGESTVSRVLRNHGSFSGKARERVLDAVERLGYVPNRIAGTLASAGSRLVAFVIPSLTNIVFPDVLRGAGAVLEENRYQAVFSVTDYEPEREEALVAAMLAWRPTAVMLAGFEHTEGTLKMLRASGCRVVELLDIDGTAIDLAVGFSNREAGRASAEFLLKRGYRRIGYVGHDLGRDTRAGKRFEGFREALNLAGVPLLDREIRAGASSVGSGRAGLEQLLRRAPGLDAVYFSNDDMALGGYFHCLARTIPVPTRLALFGHNGLDIGQATPQPLTTIRTPRVATGKLAAELVINDHPSHVADLGFELIEGATA